MKAKNDIGLYASMFHVLLMFIFCIHHIFKWRSPDGQSGGFFCAYTFGNMFIQPLCVGGMNAVLSWKIWCHLIESG
ncbi:MAG: hypothetical protein C6P36_00135 [Geobacillus sp.]|nr:MAG: hypothetical protein C6P36_00135 [Geobacillus sp.]